MNKYLKMKLFISFLLSCLLISIAINLILMDLSSTLEKSDFQKTNQINTLESAFISCLNGHGVSINGYWNDCKLKADFWEFRYEEK